MLKDQVKDLLLETSSVNTVVFEGKRGDRLVVDNAVEQLFKSKI